DAAVAIHNHPRWGTIWADLCRRPEIYDQTGAMYHGEVAIFDDYLGSVDHPEVAQAAVKAMGDAGVLLLANHGVLIVGADVHQAARLGDRVCTWFEDEPVTYAQMQERGVAAANGLLALGVGPGDGVVILMENSPELLYTWFGAALLGAVSVPINTANRGTFLS